MPLPVQIIVGLVALEHLYILWFEMFAWTSRGKKVFKNFPEHLFEPTKALAANQGLYNGFLAAGLIWSLLIKDASWSENIAIFFLSCVAVAAIYGGLTADRKILIVQGLLPVMGLLWIAFT
jgi:putative membrane protein